MNPKLLDVLVSTTDHSPLELEAPRDLDGEVEDAVLVDTGGGRFHIQAGVPRMAAHDSPSTQADEGASASSFGAKWSMYAEEEKDDLASFQYRWFDDRFGFGDEAGLRAFLAGKEWILDAGTGPGLHATRCARLCRAQVVGLDLSDSVGRAHERYGSAPNLHYVQGDILEPPFAPGSFDFVFSDQVIHHTPDCELAFRTLAELVRPGGEIAVYVYRKKSLVRELADEHIRELTTRMSVDECLEFSEQITELGRELSRVDATVTLEKGVPLLGIEPGEHDVQRLIYWNLLKCFWNEELGQRQSVMVNFDWYHPPYASRHTKDEVVGWCRGAGLEVAHLDVIESGISVRARRPNVDDGR